MGCYEVTSTAKLSPLEESEMVNIIFNEVSIITIPININKAALIVLWALLPQNHNSLFIPIKSAFWYDFSVDHQEKIIWKMEDPIRESWKMLSNYELKQPE